MRNYVLNFGNHKVAISYSEDTSISAVVNLIKDIASRYYPKLELGDIKGTAYGYIIYTYNGDDITITIEEIDGIFSLS